jgi:hypothetical protein
MMDESRKIAQVADGNVNAEQRHDALGRQRAAYAASKVPLTELHSLWVRGCAGS